MFHGDNSKTKLIPFIDIQNFEHGSTAIAKFIAKKINSKPDQRSWKERGRIDTRKNRDRTGRIQDRTGRDQTGRKQDRTGKKQDRTGRKQDRTGRKRDQRFLDMRQARQRDVDVNHTLQGELENWPLNHDKQQLVDTNRKMAILNDFCKSTSNSALKQRACCVCQEGHFENEMVLIRANQIPNLHLLTTSQGDERIYLGDRHEDDRVYLCRGCEKTLSRSKPQAPENSIFITYLGGKQPECLKGLTLPEMLMISPVICKAYVVKLVSYGDPNSCQRAINSRATPLLSCKTSPVLQNAYQTLVQPQNT